MELLFQRLVPVYFRHRYAIAAAAKALGGVDYRYPVRGDEQVAVMPTQTAAYESYLLARQRIYERTESGLKRAIALLDEAIAQRILSALVPAQVEIALTAADLPRGNAPPPVPFPHFPDHLHAFVWRNWQLVPARRMAEVVGAGAGDVVRLGRSMGLAGPPRITVEQQRRMVLAMSGATVKLLGK